MVLRFLMRIFGNNEQVVQKLSESYPMRRAAQVVVSIFYRGKYLMKDSNVTPQNLAESLKRIQHNFKKELKQAQEEMKRK